MTGRNLADNCRHCPELGSTCQGNDASCLCFRCPRNLGQCILLRYCRETESVLELAERPELSEERWEEVRRRKDGFIK